MLVSASTLSLTYGTIVSDVDALFPFSGASIPFISIFLILATGVSLVFALLFPKEIDLWFASSRKRSFITKGGFFTFVFTVITLLTVAFGLRGVAPERPEYHSPSFNQAAEDVFGEDVEVRVFGSNGELKESLNLHPDDYDNEARVYSGIVLVANFQGLHVEVHEVTVDLEGTVTFTKIDNESVGNDDDGGAK